jgi:DNA-binding protein HU-beta
MPKQKAVRRRPMRQSELIDQLAETTGLNRKQVKLFLTELASLAQREVRLTGEFTLPGLGTLVRAQRTSRLGRNPATGEQINIPARSTIKFKVSKSLKSAAAGDNTTESDI